MMNRYACILFLVVLSALSVRAATNAAASANGWDIQAAINAASNGDTVTVPAGVGNVTNTITIANKGIQLIGAGDGADLSGAYTNMVWTTNAGTQTILVDLIANRATPLIEATWTNNSHLLRVSGFHLQAGTNTSDLLFGVIMIRGSSRLTNGVPIMFDNLYFDQVNGRPFNIYSFHGVARNCVIDNRFGNSGIAFDGRMPSSEEKGHWSWATPVDYGTTNAFYIEACYITNSVTRAITDGFAGARFVFRYNTCHNVAAENHGTESTGIFRGTRSMEIYGNGFYCNVAGERAVHFRSGTGLVFSNYIQSPSSWPGMMRLATYRMLDPFSSWKQADGTNEWDVNDGVVYESGTHTGTNGASILVDDSKAWSANQWVGYTIRNVSRSTISSNGAAGVISANTTTTLSRLTPVTAYNGVYWTNGQSYQIVRVTQALDAPGNSWGLLLTGGSNSPETPASPVGWPFQTNSEPIYFWANVGKTNVDISTYDIVAGRQYTNIALADYTPLDFPHPLAGGAPEGGEPGPRTINAGTVTVGGNLIVGGN